MAGAARTAPAYFKLFCEPWNFEHLLILLSMRVSIMSNQLPTPAIANIMKTLQQSILNSKFFRYTHKHFWFSQMIL